jgi:hypothetical protein
VKPFGAMGVMQSLVAKETDWMHALTLALTTGATFCTGILYVLYHSMSRFLTMAATLHHEMKAVADPVGTGCLAASTLLVLLATVELFRKRRKEAMWNLVFAVLALFCWTLAQSLTVRVK